MGFDARKFFEDFNIEYVTSGKNVSKGWYGFECPRCDDTSDHGGIDPNSGAVNCWRCGGMSIEELIKRMLQCSWSEAKRIKQEYGGYTGRSKVQRKAKEKDIEVKLPPGTKEIKEPHRNYLINRNFDPDLIDEIWDIYGTGHLGDYNFRIVAPIYFENRLVSFQTRDITDRSPIRYKACPVEKERIHHKHTLYGYDLSKKDVVVTEGIFDCWRLGAGAVATFGASWTFSQLKLLTKFRRVFVIFDEDEKQSVDKGIDLSLTLEVMGISSEFVYLGKNCDPADLSDDDATHLMKELLIK